MYGQEYLKEIPHKTLEGVYSIIQYTANKEIVTNQVTLMSFALGDTCATFEPVFLIKTEQDQVIVYQSDKMILDKQYKLDWFGNNYNLVKSKSGVDLLRL